MPALTTTQISDIYGIPSDLVRQVVLRLNNLGLIAMEESEGELSEHPLLPGIDVSQLSVEKVISCLRENGSHDFIPGFSDRFPGAIAVVDKITDAMLKTGSDITVSSINIKV